MTGASRKGSGMKRAILAVIIFLLLGAATSVAVAWAVILWESPLRGQYQVRERDWIAAVDFYPASVGIAAVNREGERGERFEYDYPDHDLLTDAPWWSLLKHWPATDGACLSEAAAGWPLPCLRVAIESEDPILVPRLHGALRGGIDGASPLAGLPGDWTDAEYLPIEPIWPYFVVNAFLLGTAWLAITLIPSIWRLNRAIRRRLRGRCEICGYSLAGISAEVCPECGRKRGDRPLFISRRCLWSGALIALLLIVAEVTFAAAFIALRPYAPIHLAAYQGDAPVVRAELRRGVDVDAPLNLDGTYIGTPLWLASRGEPEIVSMLIDAGADVHVQGEGGATPLHVAAEFGRVDVIRLLLEAGAEVDAPGWYGMTALSEAAVAQKPRAVRALLEAGADVNGGGEALIRALDFACMQGDWEIFEILIDAGAAVPPPQGARVDPLALVLRRGRVEFVERLLELGAAITDEAMLAAVRHARLDVLRLFVDRGGNVHARDTWDGTLLFSLSPVEEQRPLWEYLIGEGVDINAINGQGQTVLLYWLDGWGVTSEGGPRSESVRFLLEFGADPTIAGADGFTAFDYTYGELEQTMRQAAEKQRREVDQPSAAEGDE
jgi:ankyrin repeat protein